MAKTKAVQSQKDAQVKSLSSVKQGAVTKPSQTSKSKSKDIAKEVAVKADNLHKEEKKSRKAKKEPSPEPSPSASDEEDSSDVSDSSASSASSDESEAQVPFTKAAAKTNGLKTDGVAKVAPDAESDDEESNSFESSASSDDDIEEPFAPKSAPAAAANHTVAGAKEESESEEEEDSDEDSSEDDKETPNKGPVDAKALNGKLEEVASKEVCKRLTAISNLVITDLYRFLPMRNRAATTPRLAHLRDHLMQTVKRKTAKRKRTRRLLLQLLRSARPKLRPILCLKRPKPSLWVTRLPRETFSLDASRIMSTKNGSLASSRALGNYPQFESSLIVILAAPKGKATSPVIVWVDTDTAVDMATLNLSTAPTVLRHRRLCTKPRSTVAPSMSISPSPSLLLPSVKIGPSPLETT